MKFFIDTANVEDIRKANDMGVICGVTTNPSLIAKEGRDFKEVIKEITTIVDGPISGEVKAGATYVSPFLGRLDDISTAGISLIEDIVTIFDNYGLETEIIAASIRHPMHVTDCALAGAHIATVPYKVIEQMTHHPLTDQGIAKFQADYKAVFGE